MRPHYTSYSLIEVVTKAGLIEHTHVAGSLVWKPF